MDIIELERWKPSQSDPRLREYDGQRTGLEVFHELKYRLESMGYLPDEYFEIGFDWSEGQEIPKGADIFCTTDYGESEGVYLDVYLKWYENHKPITKSFITGKTLGENGNDMDRMFLISSAITKAFHGDHGTYARFMRIDGQEDTGGAVLHLSLKEQLALTDILKARMEQLGQQGQNTSAVEQLLRRVSGTGMQEANLQLNDYQKAQMAIRDGDLNAFKEYAAKVPESADSLLIEAAGRPGIAGRELTVAALSDRKDIDYDVYCAACKKAIDICDTEKSLFLVHWAEHCVPNLEPSFYGEMAQYHYWENPALSRTIIGVCTPEQIAAAPSSLLYAVVMQPDFRTARSLVEKGISGGENSWRILHTLTYENRNSWMAESLLQQRMWVDPEDYYAMRSCIENDAVDVAKQLLKNGMDYEKFQEWAESHYWGGSQETLQALSDFWQELKAPQQEEAPEQGGMRFV